MIYNKSLLSSIAAVLLVVTGCTEFTPSEPQPPQIAPFSNAQSASDVLVSAAQEHAERLDDCEPVQASHHNWLDNAEYAAPSLPVAKHADVWERVLAGYTLGDIQHPRIDAQKRWFLKNPDYMSRVSRRAARYMFHVVDNIDEAGMPMEIALLPIIESAFDPFAYSHGRASGMWQFISATGKQYGMQQNWWYDGRRDVLASTNGAISYLQDLHKEFKGDWLLALAAYNTGEGNVRKAIRRNKRAGKPTDFWNLRLPRETKAYVPRLLAVAELLAERDTIGQTFHPIANEAYFEAIDIGSQLDLAQAAKLANISTDELYLLNPGLNRWATPPAGPHRLLVPFANAEPFKRALLELPKKQRVSGNHYKVRRGDTLSTIARKFNTSVKVIKEANSLKGSLISVRQTLAIPSASANKTLYALSESQRKARHQGLASGSGKKLKVTVKRGDSLWAIAKRHGVSVRQLARWNGMVPKDPLRVGQKLVLWSKSSRLSSMVRKVGYKVRRGDSLSRIARKFRVATADITRWNSIQRESTLRPGQSLILYVDVRNAS